MPKRSSTDATPANNVKNKYRGPISYPHFFRHPEPNYRAWKEATMKLHENMQDLSKNGRRGCGAREVAK